MATGPDRREIRCKLAWPGGLGSAGGRCFTTDRLVLGGLSGASPSEAVSLGTAGAGVLPDAVVLYGDSTIAFPLVCEYAVGPPKGRRPGRELLHKRAGLAAGLLRQAKERAR